MKTRSLCAGAVRALLISAAVAILAACAPPLDNRAEGNLRIVLPGGASAGARAAIDPPEDVSYYRLDFSGPGGETRSENLQPGTELTLTLSLGQWIIRAKAFTAEDVLRGSGEIPVTVEAGRINEAMIALKKALADITAFSFATPPAEGTINADKTIAVTVPFDTDVTSLIPTITHLGVSISPDPDEAQDFTAPVIYTVTAANGDKAEWTVTVTVQEQNTIRLAGTVTVVKPDSLVLTGITVTAYKEAERTTVIETAAFSPGEGWSMEFPLASLADSGAAWFRVSATDGTGSYTVDAGDSGAIPESGITNLDLSLAIYRIGIDPAMVWGSVAADKRYETAGNTIGLTVTPDTDYRLKSGTLQYSDGDLDYPLTGSGPGYSFIMPASDVTISAFFNRVLGFAIEGPRDEMIPVAVAHSADSLSPTDSSPAISWSGDESLTFTVDAAYSAEAGNLKWLLNGEELEAAENSLVIRARDYVPRHYTLTVMIEAHDLWYSGEQGFTVVR